MIEVGNQEEHEKPGLSEVLDWTTWDTWAIFLGVYLGLTAFMVIAIILSQALLYDFFQLDREDPNHWAELVLILAFYSVAAIAFVKFIGRISKDRPAEIGAGGLWFQICKSAVDLVIPGLGVILGTVSGFILLELHARLLGLPHSWLPYQGLVMSILLLNGHGVLIVLLAHYKHPRRKSSLTQPSNGEAS